MSHPFRRGEKTGYRGIGWVLLAGVLGVVSGPRVPASPRPTEDQDEGPKQTRQVTAEGYRVQLDLSGQVLRLSIPEDRGRARGEEPGQEEAPITPTLSPLTEGRFVSGSMLAQKAKQFDDGLYAAVELAAQRGQGRFAGKAALLKALAQALTRPAGQPIEGAPALVLGAAKLGNVDIDLPESAEGPVQETIDEFLKDELRSRPIGFYTWNRDLTAIFQQDRLLQTELTDREGTERLVKALHQDRRSRETYEAYLGLASRLTNPPAYPDLRRPLADLDRGEPKVPDGDIYLFPPSRAHETDLIKKLYGDRPIPEGFNLADEMIRRIRSGRLALRPTAESGWYDYQTWALEPLVIPEKMPEARHLNLDPSYTKQLLELFKGILALTRETHIKQLDIPEASERADSEVVIDVYPGLSVEPLPSYYFRRARSYAFIRRVLEQTFGAPALEKMHRLTAAGPVKPSLAEELRTMEALFHGAHVTACREIGLPPGAVGKTETGKTGPADAAAFAGWQGRFQDDPDLGQDARMMVPVFYDVQRKKTKVWVFLGWTTRPVQVDFEKAPEAVIFKSGKRVTGKGPRLHFEGESHRLAYPVTAEVYVTKVLNRAEFRRLCDRYQTRSAILAHLR